MKKCKFYKLCELYQEYGFTCNDYTAEEGYCGRYKKFEVIINERRLKKK